MVTNKKERKSRTGLKKSYKEIQDVCLWLDPKGLVGSPHSQLLLIYLIRICRCVIYIYCAVCLTEACVCRSLMCLFPSVKCRRATVPKFCQRSAFCCDKASGDRTFFDMTSLSKLQTQFAGDI